MLKQKEDASIESVTKTATNLSVDPSELSSHKEQIAASEFNNPVIVTPIIKGAKLPYVQQNVKNNVQKNYATGSGMGDEPALTGFKGSIRTLMKQFQKPIAEIVQFFAPASSLANSSLEYRYLAQRIAFDLQSKTGGWSIGLSSFHNSNETALLLAYFLAEEIGKPVLLVDAVLGGEGVSVAVEPTIRSSSLLQGISEVGFRQCLNRIATEQSDNRKKCDRIKENLAKESHGKERSDRSYWQQWLSRWTFQIEHSSVFLLPIGEGHAIKPLPLRPEAFHHFNQQLLANFDIVIYQQSSMLDDPRYLQMAKAQDLLLLHLEERVTSVQEFEKVTTLLSHHHIDHFQPILAV